MSETQAQTTTAPATETTAPAAATPPAASAPEAKPATTEGQAAQPTEGQQNTNELILDKFKTVEDLKKGYKELEGKLHGKIPKEYLVDGVEDDNFKLERNSPSFKGFLDAAKNLRLSQEQVEGVLKAYKQDVLSRTVNAAEEIKKLGPDGQEQINTMKNWLSNNLSQESFKAIAHAIDSAMFVRAMQEIKGKMRQQPVPNSGDINTRQQGINELQYKKWVTENLDKIKNDPALQREMEERANQAFG